MPNSSSRRPVCWSRGTRIDRGQLHAVAAGLADRLPAGPAALNLCERRENFLIGFLALLVRGQTCLLPPSRAPEVVSEVMREHPGCYRLDDELVSCHRGATRADEVDLSGMVSDRVVVIAYTSGSTGQPRAHPKTWASLVASTALNSAQLREATGTNQHDPSLWLVATVPPQHMYGFEMSVLMPLLGGMAVHAGHPLYPADVEAALWELPEPRVLVTTPVHLRVLIDSRIALPPLAAVVSATAPLSQDMAQAVEQHFRSSLLEFFGSTETCVFASRRAARESAWRTYPGVGLKPKDDGTSVYAPWFAEEVALQDVLELRDDGGFVVRGRNTDMVDVGGKRASLADLTRRLMSVPGVSDAVFFQPDVATGSGVQRLAALAVAEGLTEAQVLAHLVPLMDPVFLPRPLVLVSRLPRNDVGKLPRDRLLEVLKR